MPMFLEAKNLKKTFRAEPVLAGVSFSLEREATLGILGRSGSGKTTLLKILAGLESADSGEIAIEGQNVGHLEPRKRGIVYLYQEPLLFPHLDVFENLAFGLRLRGAAETEIEARVDEMLGRLGLAAHARKEPQKLSGGQRQRVSFGRALIVSPRLLLLDEPFSNLDADTRTEMQALFREVAAAYRITAILVTHDLKEAIRMSGTLAHLEQGRLRIYRNLAEALADPSLGAARELDFWQSLAGKAAAEERA